MSQASDSSSRFGVLRHCVLTAKCSKDRKRMLGVLRALGIGYKSHVAWFPALS